MTAYDAPPPPPPPPRRSGCSTLAVGCAGMILGSILTIAVQLTLIGYGIDLLTRGWRDATRTPAPQPPVTVTADRVPESFGGYSIAELAQRCDGGTFEVADKKLHAACDEMRAYMRQHGAAPDVIP